MKFISIVTNGSALLGVAALPLWILGVPGTENKYAQGWKMGLQVILFYPLFILAVRSGGFSTSHFSSAASVQVAKWENGVALAAWLMAAKRLMQSFRTMK